MTLWFLKESRILSKFNNSLKGLHYQIHNTGPGSTEVEYDFYNEISEPGLSLHLHPILYYEGQIESNCKVSSFIKTKEWKVPLPITPEKLIFMEDPNKKLFNFVKQNIWALYLSIFCILINLYIEIAILIFTCLMLIMLANVDGADPKKEYFVMSLWHRNTQKDEKLFNFLTSCMYSGTFNPSEVEQDFRLNLTNDSMVGKHFHPVSRVRHTYNRELMHKCLGGNSLDFANQSSVGCALLLGYLNAIRLPSLGESFVPKSGLWIKTYSEVFERLRDRRPGPALIKPWAGQEKHLSQQNLKIENTHRINQLSVINLMKKNYIPHFRRPYLHDPNNIDPKTGKYPKKKATKNFSQC